MGDGSLTNILFIGLMFFVFYFFMIRPQMKKQKELKKFRDGLAKGDHIVSIGGIHGKVLEVTDATVLIESEKTKLRLDKSAVSQSGDELLQAK
ncbi:MAG: preprotein translocase subunit YajC [Crocinitomicaceae bacterium]|jgi:preprotein translocase subunit YajC|nr:preprotein translocase subunit YajC [Crocinitomicaceae bacterium]MDG1734975.1 preprotein translocase subunit YajC [Crocinitomicaceae bacterium]